MNQSVPKLFRTYIAALEFLGMTGLFFFSVFLMTEDLTMILDTAFLLGFCLLILIRLLLNRMLEPYKDMTKRGMYREFRNVLKLDTWQLLLLVLFLYTLGEISTFTRIPFFIFYILELIFDFTIRCNFKRYLNRRYKQSSASQKLLIITVSSKVEAIIQSMKENDEWFYEISGCIILDRNMKGESILGIPVVAGRDELQDYIVYHVVDAVFIDGNMGSEEFHNILELLDKIGSMVYINMSNFGVKLANERVIRIGGFTTLASSMREITPLQSFTKRGLDILGGLVGSILTLLITMILAPAIKLDSHGPVFFAQKRVGKNGRIFNIYKFRSMYLDAEARKADLLQHNKMEGFMFKLDNDPRITRVGRFIRKTSLDEFPQFFNVLKGDMSLVGTRPPTLNEFEQYHAHHKKRLSMKPGITGLWQISGRNDITDFEEVVKLDAEYIDTWDIGMDIRILLKTVLVVFKREGSQ